MKRSRGNRFADIFYSVRKVLGFLLIGAVVLILIIFLASRAVLAIGEANLRKGVNGLAPSLSLDEGDSISTDDASSESQESAETWEEGWIRYNGKIYAYNEDIVTILVLGIDKDDKVSESTTLTDGGQADAIFLVAANPHTEEIKLIAVNRDTIVDVVMVGTGTDGTDVVYASQIAVQHGFGDGMEESCELTRDRVSELFYDLPINAYLSFNIGGIAALNDALGDVEITLEEDLTWINSDWTQGSTITLKGKEATCFIRKRDTNEFESARSRLERQKTYINAAVKKAFDLTKQDITTPVTIYNSFKDYIVTDLTMDEIAYLAGEWSGYQFDTDIYSLEGTTEMKGEHEGFYPDGDALQQLIIEVFYEEVETD